MNKPTIVIGTALALLSGFYLASRAYRSNRTAELTTMASDAASVFAPAHAQTYGSADARVTIVEFFDPACETCRAFYPLVKQIMDAYPGRVRLVLRYAPFHPGADQVVAMLEAARLQGRYFETLELMYASQPMWASHHQPNLDALWQILPKAGVDVARIRVDMNRPEIAKLIAKDIADTRTLHVTKTPGFFVNGKPLEPFGAQQLQQLVAEQVALAYGP